MSQQDNAFMGKRRWNVIFLLDQTPPTKVVLLKRSPNKTFAPNLYTGIGGKVEPGESIIDSAYRELQEETGLTDIPLFHFADCVIDHVDTISCLFGVIHEQSLPESDEGILEWVPLEELFNKDLIPTARYYLTAWKAKKFSLTKQWSVYLRETRRIHGVRIADVVEVREGLYG